MAACAWAVPGTKPTDGACHSTAAAASPTPHSSASTRTRVNPARSSAVPTPDPRRTGGYAAGDGHPAGPGCLGMTGAGWPAGGCHTGPTDATGGDTAAAGRLPGPTGTGADAPA